jgi:hypothetical protein
MFTEELDVYAVSFFTIQCIAVNRIFVATVLFPWG